MPFERPTLSELRTDVAQDISAALPGTDPLLRFSNLQVTGAVQAMLVHLLYGYLDWIAQQATPFTATDEFLEAWASLVSIFRKPTTQASGTVLISGSAAATVPAGTRLQRGDGQAYLTNTDVVLAAVTGPGPHPYPYTATVLATAVADPGGLKGAAGNCDAGTLLIMQSAIEGVVPSCTAATLFTGGADIEGKELFRARTLQRYSEPPQGGAATDYVAWAETAPGVSRAWCAPNLAGAGTVTVFVMLDDAQSEHGGFPQGTNGVSQLDRGPGGVPRDVVATGDQLTVADVICVLAPVTALVYIVAPTPQAVPITIANIAGVSADTKAAIAAALANALRLHADLTGGATTFLREYLDAAVAGVAGTEGFVITSPSNNVAVGVGALPTLGLITYT